MAQDFSSIASQFRYKLGDLGRVQVILPSDDSANKMYVALMHFDFKVVNTQQGSSIDNISEKIKIIRFEQANFENYRHLFNLPKPAHLPSNNPNIEQFIFNDQTSFKNYQKALETAGVNFIDSGPYSESANPQSKQKYFISFSKETFSHFSVLDACFRNRPTLEELRKNKFIEIMQKFIFEQGKNIDNLQHIAVVAKIRAINGERISDEEKLKKIINIPQSELDQLKNTQPQNNSKSNFFQKAGNFLTSVLESTIQSPSLSLFESIVQLRKRVESIGLNTNTNNNITPNTAQPISLPPQSLTESSTTAAPNFSGDNFSQGIPEQSNLSSDFYDPNEDATWIIGSKPPENTSAILNTGINNSQDIPEESNVSSDYCNEIDNQTWITGPIGGVVKNTSGNFIYQNNNNQQTSPTPYPTSSGSVTVAPPETSAEFSEQNDVSQESSYKNNPY